MLAHFMEQELEERLAAQPLVKWVGGKSAMVPRIMRAMPATFGTYLEPFAGGAAVAFALEAHHGAHPLVLGDANADLVATYATVAQHPEEVIRQLRRMAAKHQQNAAVFYYHVRERWNARSGWTAVNRAAAFLYLNRTCFNGLWRVNRAGDFNVPLGDYTNPTICDPDRIRAAAAVLQRATLLHGDWRQTLVRARAGDVVFLDPPYVPRGPTSNFTAYGAGGFGDDEQRALAKEALALVRRGVHVIATNHDVPRVRELYGSRHWKRRRVMMSRAISSRAAGRAAVAELLIVGRP